MTRLVVGVHGLDDDAGIEAIETGLSKYFPRHSATIVTGENVMRRVLEKSEELDAEAVAVIEPERDAEAIDNLLRPILHARYDLAAAHYAEPPDEGAITKLILYPLTRALYGSSVRFPAGSEFGLSARLARRLLDRIPSIPPVATTAIAEGFRVCESFMGPRPVGQWRRGADLHEILAASVGATFDLMDEYERIWRKSQPAPAPEFFGYPYVAERRPGKLGSRRDERRNLREVWERFLRAETIRRIMELEPDAGFPDGLWTQIVFEFACAWRGKPIPRRLILDTLQPLYFAKLASYAAETADSEPEAVEDRIERLCRMFETLKPYLVSRWSGEPANALTQDSAQLEVRPNG